MGVAVFGEPSKEGAQTRPMGLPYLKISWVSGGQYRHMPYMECLGWYCRMSTSSIRRPWRSVFPGHQALVAFCFEDYGECTGLGFDSFGELKLLGSPNGSQGVVDVEHQKTGIFDARGAPRRHFRPRHGGFGRVHGSTTSEVRLDPPIGGMTADRFC